MNIERAGGVELVVRGDRARVRTLVEEFFVGRGWRPRRRGEGRVDYERGSRRRTLLLGGLARRTFFLTAQVTLITGAGTADTGKDEGASADDGDGGTVVRYTWGAGEGQLLGGSLGRARALREHAETAEALRADLDRAGLLRTVRRFPGS